MIDPTMTTLAWRLSRQAERERRDAEDNLGRWVARLYRSRWWRAGSGRVTRPVGAESAVRGRSARTVPPPG